jgi:hypothetical protein
MQHTSCSSCLPYFLMLLILRFPPRRTLLILCSEPAHARRSSVTKTGMMVMENRVTNFQRVMTIVYHPRWVNGARQEGGQWTRPCPRGVEDATGRGGNDMQERWGQCEQWMTSRMCISNWLRVGSVSFYLFASILRSIHFPPVCLLLVPLCQHIEKYPLPSCRITRSGNFTAPTHHS